jgi:DUF4097 and DUF4098 domain-containing protein YvlB
MNNQVVWKWSSAMTALLVLLLGGCIIICNSCSTTPPCKAERTVAVSGDMATEVLLSAQTSNGNITVQGRQVGGCEVTAHITARDNTEQEAKDLAEAVAVSLIPSQQGITVDIKKPESELSSHIDVSLDIKMPGQNRLDLKTSNGNIKVSDISRDIALHTSNGNITLNHIAGPIAAYTTNGNVDCHDVGKDFQARTSNGNVNVIFSESAEGASRIDIETSNGSIGITPPKTFSATVDAATSNGKITSNKALTVQGDISKDSLHGTIGTGAGTCQLHTSNGSIHIN